jgi:hypothetical protein
MMNIKNDKLQLMDNRKIKSIPMLYMLLVFMSSCGGNSDTISDFVPETPVRQDLRIYLAGDYSIFTGTVSVIINGEITRESPVEVIEEFLSGKRIYLDKIILTRITKTRFLETGEEQIIEQSLWQETNGEMFELTNEYGNEYVIDNAFDRGLLNIPSLTLVNGTEHQQISFHTMYGGSVSGPVTEGEREITLAPIENIEVGSNQYQAFPLIHKHTYKYLFTYVDNKSGSSVVIDRNLWVSLNKGLVRRVEVEREYSRFGVLQSETHWDLELESTNF